MPRLVVLYVFHIYNERVRYFIDNAIFYDENIDFVMISNDKENNFEVPPYAYKMYRDNIGFDFGGWSDAILMNNLHNEYDYFLFVNSSVIGPFVPNDYIGNWTDIYLNGLKDNVKLFGSTINAIGEPEKWAHVQSYIFCMDKITLHYLIDCEIFSITNYAANFHEAIWDKEVWMSRIIIGNGWNIGSLLPCYDMVDFTFKDKTPEEYNITFFRDVMDPEYNDILWNKYQLVFIKGNRIEI